MSVKHALKNLPTEAFDLLTELVEQRINGTPLAYIVGRQNFMGLELLSSSAALIPRKETEQLAGVCLDFIQKILESQETIKIMDHFTGSGNLPLCFSSRFPQAEVYGADISEQAIELARKNAEHLKLPVKFEIGDMFSPFESERLTSELFVILIS